MKILLLLKRELAHEAAMWVDEGIISREQAGDILGLYGTRLPSKGQRSVGYYVLLSIAALFMGLAVIVILSANWDQIPRWTRMASLVTLTVALNCLGLLYFKREKIRLSRVWFFLGAIVYGASIFLIAQIYHLGEHFPDGILYWALGVLPMAILLDSLLIMLLLGAISSLWLIVESQFGFFPFFYPIFILTMFWYCFCRQRSLFLFLLAVAGSVFFCEVMVMHFLGEDLHGIRFTSEHVFFTGGIFILLHWLGDFFETHFPQGSDIMDYGLVLRLWTIRFGIIILLIFSFEEPWIELLESSQKAIPFILGCTIITPLLLGVGALCASGSGGAHSDGSLKTLIYGGASRFGFGAFYCLCNLLIIMSGPDRSGLSLLLQVITNLVLLLTGIRLIIGAFISSRSLPFYTGVGVLLVTALLRYIDLIGDYVSGAVVFFMAGLIMFTAARFWKRHLSIREDL